MKILVLQMAKLGDFIQSVPLLAALKEQRPEAKLILAAGEKSVLEAARLFPLADEIRPVGLGPAAHDPVGPDPVGPAWPDEEFEAVFVLNSDLKAARLAGRLKAAACYGPRAEGENLVLTPGQNFLTALMAEDRRLARFNLVDLWLSLLPGAGPPARPPARRAAKEGPYKIGFHLGAGHHLRRWPTEYFVRLARELEKEAGPITPVLTGSAAERSLGARFEKLWGRGGVINLQGATDLKGLAGTLAGLDLLATADTGVMHLAAAVRAPVLALFFGPAYGPETGPYGPGHVIYQAGGPCAPCREGACPRRQCLSQPEPETAARLAAHMLKGADPGPLPAGHRAWLSGLDAFGQVLLPFGRPPLTSEEALALALTWRGRSIFRPGHEDDLGSLSRLISGYAPASPAPPAALLSRLAGRLPWLREPDGRLEVFFELLGLS